MVYNRSFPAAGHTGVEMEYVNWSMNNNNTNCQNATQPQNYSELRSYSGSDGETQLWGATL